MTDEQKEIEKIRGVLAKFIAWSAGELGMDNAQILLRELGPDSAWVASRIQRDPIEQEGKDAE